MYTDKRQGINFDHIAVLKDIETIRCPLFQRPYPFPVFQKVYRKPRVDFLLSVSHLLLLTVFLDAGEGRGWPDS